jgi:hypothetical protein
MNPLDIHSFITLAFVASILILTLLLVRRHNRKKRREELTREIEEGDYQDIELIRVQNPNQQDEIAYELIEAERQKVLTSFSLKTSLAPRKIWNKSFDLIKKIATIYHPDIEDPQLQASIVDLLELNERIVKRLQGYLETFPFNTIKDFNIQDGLTYKKRIEKISRFTEKHKNLYYIGKYAWMGYNVLNLWYWNWKLIKTTGKEGTYRRLWSVILKVVGEEAVIVYSKRYIRKESLAFEKNIAFEMINMALVDNVVSIEEYDVILKFILNNSNFDDRIKVILLKVLKRKRPIKTDIPVDIYNEKEKKRLLSEVKRVAKADKLDTLKKREALIALGKLLELTTNN